MTERATRRAETKEAAAKERATRKAEAKEAAARERAARKAAQAAAKESAALQARLSHEREAAAAKLARLTSELHELRRSYHLSGASKKLDLAKIDGFSQIAGETVAAGRTGMHLDRLYTLWQTIHAAPPAPAMIEIGAYLGGSARFIIDTLQAAGRTPRFYVCDTFAGHADTDAAIDTSHHGADKFERASAQDTSAYLAAAGYPALDLVVGDIVETSAQIDEESFSFVHLDVDVYPTTDFCLRHFAPRLADDALMVIDDYGFITCPGVKRAVDGFVAECPQYRLFHLLSGQALLSRRTTEPVRRSDAGSRWARR
jgi:hypothetical protein